MEWNQVAIVLTSAILLAWLPFLVPWKKFGVAPYDNYGPCQGPHCRVMAYRCTGWCCGPCCRKLHGSYEKHEKAPPLSGEVTRATDGPAHAWPTPPAPPKAVEPSNKLPARYGGVDNKKDETKEPEVVKPPTPGDMVVLDDAGDLVSNNSAHWQPKVFD